MLTCTIHSCKFVNLYFLYNLYTCELINKNILQKKLAPKCLYCGLNLAALRLVYIGGMFKNVPLCVMFSKAG